MILKKADIIINEKTVYLTHAKIHINLYQFLNEPILQKEHLEGFKSQCLTLQFSQTIPPLTEKAIQTCFTLAQITVKKRRSLTLKQVTNNPVITLLITGFLLLITTSIQTKTLEEKQLEQERKKTTQEEQRIQTKTKILKQNQAIASYIPLLFKIPLTLQTCELTKNKVQIDGQIIDETLLEPTLQDLVIFQPVITPIKDDIVRITLRGTSDE